MMMQQITPSLFVYSTIGIGGYFNALNGSISAAKYYLFGD
jgi:hypothetical protein